MKAKIREFFLLFLAGASIYPLIEVLFRGYTHISMSILGGICLMAIRFVDLCLYKSGTIWKSAVSAVIITQLEFLAGVIVNLFLGLAVWDYSDRAFHLAGQICPLFSFFWFLLSIIALHLIRLIFPESTSKKSPG